MKRKRVGTMVVVGFALLLVVLAVQGKIFAADEGSCQNQPEPYEYLSEQSATDEEGNPIYIARAIIASGKGEPISGKGELVFPPCWSEDDHLLTVSNMSVKLHATDEQVLIIVGVVGGFSPYPFEPEALPQP